jgi:predicted amidophosphoribosyltransferase
MWATIRPWLFPVWCIGCGAPEVGLCAACAAAARPVTTWVDGLPVRAAGDYAGPLREALLATKHGERAYLDPLARLLAPLVDSGAVVVPLVTTRRRAAERGFDQARELARRVAALRAGTCAELLRKRGGAQRGLGRAERLTARGRFALRPGAGLPVRAVLLDDVVTTGATLRDAARVLAAAGCTVLGAVVVARTPPGRETPRRGGRLVGA